MSSIEELRIKLNSVEDAMKIALDTLAEMRLMLNEPITPVCGVRLLNHGPSKISVIKLIREYVVESLKEAKDLSEQTPSLLKPTVQRDTYTFASKLEDVGAIIEICYGDCDTCVSRFSCYTT